MRSPLPLRFPHLVTVGLVVAGCAGDEPPGARGGEQTEMVSTGAPWMEVDAASQRVTVEIVAGETAENSYWNFNGYYGGDGKVVIPTGWDVFIEFRNADPAMAHSVGVDRATRDFPTDFAPIDPAFPNAVTPGAGSESGATPPGGVSSVRFRATEAGSYSIVCYVPGHAAVGQYLQLEVSDAASLPRVRP